MPRTSSFGLSISAYLDWNQMIWTIELGLRSYKPFQILHLESAFRECCVRILVCAALIVRYFLVFSYIYQTFSKPWVYYSKFPFIFKNPRCIFFLYLHSFLFCVKFSLKTLEILFLNSLDLSKFPGFMSILFFHQKSIRKSCILSNSLPLFASVSFRWRPISRCYLSQRSCLLSNKGWNPGSSGYPVSFLLPSVVLFLVRHLLAYVPRPLGWLWIGDGIGSGQANHQRQFDSGYGRTVESTYLHILVSMGRDDSANGWIQWHHGIARASWSARWSGRAAVPDQRQGDRCSRSISQSNREQILASHWDQRKSVHRPVRTLSQVWSLRGSWHLVSSSERKNSACHGPMHSGISILSRRSEFHRCQSRPTLSKMGKQADPSAFSVHGSSSLSLQRLSSFCPRRDHFGGRMHVCLAVLVPATCAIKSQFLQVQQQEAEVCVQYRALIESLHQEEILWDYFDRRESVPRYTYARSKRYRLLGPFFCVDYQPERCLRQFSQRQIRVNTRFPTGHMPEFDLQSDQWSGAYHVTKYTWDSFIPLSIFPGPNVSSEYREWWQTVCPPSLCI